MVKPYVNYFVDVFAGISSLVCIITGLIKFRGFIQFFGWSYSELPMKTITFLHDWSGIALCLFVIIHLFLHIGWIKCMTKNLLEKKSCLKD